MNKTDLLDSVTMAKFVSNGYLRFDEIIPKDLCEESKEPIALGEMDAYDKVGAPFYSLWEHSAMGKIFRLTAVRAIIESLLGPNPQYDHHYFHNKKAHTTDTDSLHQDGTYDTRDFGFDLLICFFPDDVSEKMGGTLVVPGSHFRKVNSGAIGRYQNIVGQQQLVCKAGTILFMHSNLWHAGRSNHSDNDRLLFKLRLNPTVEQVRIWNTEDINDSEIPNILGERMPWHSGEQRLENINRIRLWRYMIGDPTPDFKTDKLWGTKLDDMPKVIYHDSVRSLDMKDSLFSE